MNILQIGKPKSGNYWLYTILQHILQEGGIPQKSFIKEQPIHAVASQWDLSYQNQADIDVLDIEPKSCYFRISSIFRMPVESLDQYIHQTNHVWSHSYYNQQSANVLSKFDKIIYLIRDPRDRAISAAKFRFTPYGKYLRPHGYPDPETWLRNRFHLLIGNWVRHVVGYLNATQKFDIKILFYERLLHNFDEEFEALLSFLNVELSKNQKDLIKKEVDFQSMKSENPNHVRKGKSNRWIENLNIQQKWLARFLAGGLMQYLDYPLFSRFAMDRLPKLLEKPNYHQLNRINSFSNLKLYLIKTIRISKKIS